MNKLSMFLSFCLIFLLFSSCAPDLTSDVEYAYAHAHPSIALGSDCSVEGAFICSSDGNMSLECVGDVWYLYKTCDSYCDESTGKCSTSDSESSSGSCTTIDGNMWSPKASSTMSWSDAIDYCNNLTACGYSDWHLPTISELRTLIKNCSGTVTGDSCLSYSSCWDEDSCLSCSYDDSGKYSKLGDTDWFWSSSTRSDFPGYAWYVHFYYGYVLNNVNGNDYDVRCVR